MGQDGGDEDSGVVGGVAGVEDVGGWSGGLGPDVGAVASGLRIISFESSFSFLSRGQLTISMGFIMGYDQRLLVKNPTHRKVVFFARSGSCVLISSAAWSLLCCKLSVYSETSRVPTTEVTHIHMRHIILLSTQLFARGECVQDQVLQARDVVRRSGDINKLLRLLLRGGHGSQVQQVLPEIGDAEDSIGALESGFQ